MSSLLINQRLYLWMFMVLLFISLLSISVGRDVFCFKRIYKEYSKRYNGAICRGLVNKSASAQSTFKSPNGCCRRGGAGYTEEPLTNIGKKKLKYKCTLCKEKKQRKKPIISDVTTSSVYLTTSMHASRTGWSLWNDWSDCSVSCGVGFMRRRRQCYSHPCFGEDSDTVPCSKVADCPVDGNWGPWQGWSACSTTCGKSDKTKYRFCNNPPPRHNGKECVGHFEEKSVCNQTACPVNGGWSEWSQSSCSATCGKRAEMNRTRLCDNPPPSNGGSMCEGESTEIKLCKGLSPCPRHGGWTLWSDWNPCTITCGVGIRQRTRICAAPKPRHGGDNCTGEYNQERKCYHILPCPVDGGWTNWGVWEPCSSEACTGAPGITKRKRTCKNPSPRFNGAVCVGNSTETQRCINNQYCPVDGGWCSWSNFSECRLSKAGEAFKIRTRECSCPTPENGGQICSGLDFETEECEVESEHRFGIHCKVKAIIDTEGSGLTDDENGDEEKMNSDC